MATEYPSITPEQAELIKTAPLFFVAGVDPSLQPRPDGCGPLNLSPKGGTPLHILDENHVAYLDYQGSGNETARSAALGGPMTIMLCSFNEGDAAVIRLFGHGSATPLAESPLAERLLGRPFDDIALPARQVIELTVESTQTSCGYGVPVMEYQHERTTAMRGRQYKPGSSKKRA